MGLLLFVLPEQEKQPAEHLFMPRWSYIHPSTAFWCTSVAHLRHLKGTSETFLKCPL